jgi:hypothetical protein
VAAWLARETIGVLYLAPGLTAQVPAIRTACAERKVLAISPVRRDVQEGLALGVVLEQRQPRLLINVHTLKALGIELDFRVLRIAELIR